MAILESRLLKYLHRKASQNHSPLSGTFELSPCCNMDCRMCYVRKNRAEVDACGGEISVGSWISLAEECYKAGTLFLLLTGGEPFLYKDFRKLYTELSKMGFMISINTNGTLITKEVVEWLKEIPPTRINMTLYGASNNTYETLCGNPIGFDQTIHAAKLLKEAGISVKFNASMTPYNIEDLEKIYHIAEKMNIYVQATAYMFPPLRKNKNMVGKGNRFCAKDAAHYQVQIDKLRLTEKEFRQRAKAMKDNALELPQEEDSCERNLKEPLGCRAGKSAFWVNWKGEMTACGMMENPVTYPFTDGFINSWNQLIEKTKKMYLPPECTNCKKRKVCQICGASAYTETGMVGVVPKYICEMTENIILETEKEGCKVTTK